MSKRRRRSTKAVKVFPARYNSSLIHGHRGPDRTFPRGVKIKDVDIIKSVGDNQLYPASLPSRRISIHSATSDVPETKGTYSGAAPSSANYVMTNLPLAEARARRQEEFEKSKLRQKGGVAQPPAFRAFSTWQGLRRSGIIEWNYIRIDPSPIYGEVLLVFQGSSWFIFAEKGRYQTRSILYSSKETCIDRVRTETVTWEESYTLPEEEVPPNSS